MSVRSAISAGQREEGFSLIELLIAIALIGVIMSGLAFGITGSLSVTRDSRERTIAANLASTEIELAHSVPSTNLQPGTLERVERVGVTDFTVRRVSTWENGTSEALACTALANSATGQGRSFLQVNVTVTWPGMGPRGAARSSTAITPSVATYTEGRGHVAVTVTDRAGVPRAGIPVTLTWSGAGTAPAGSPRTITTTSIGCAFFSDFTPGAYTASVNLAGYVDSETGVRLGSKAVTVADRVTANAGFTYEPPATLQVDVTGTFGGQVPNGVTVIAEAVVTGSPTRASGPGAGTETATELRTIAPVYPYQGGWNAWLGCAQNRPGGSLGGQTTAFNPAPGATARATVQAGTLRVRILSRDTSRANLVLYARDQAATAGVCDAPLALPGRFDANGRYQADVVLPFGSWRLYTSNATGAAPLNGDPTKVADGGLIQVTGGAAASYTERRSYVDTVLADSPFFYHRVDEGPPSTAANSASGLGGTYQSGVIRGVTGAITGQPTNPAVRMDATTSAYVSAGESFGTQNTFSLEVWFQTTSAQGGRLIGVGSSATGASADLDRHIYLQDDGRVAFGVRPGGTTRTTIVSPGAYNDGAWHHAVATLSTAGMRLYLDGALVVSNTSVTTAQSYVGYLRVGWDNLTGWAGSTSSAFDGAIDEAAAYGNAMSLSRVQAHYAARTGNYSAAVQTVPPAGERPTVYYRLDENFVANDTSTNNRDGTFLYGGRGGQTSALLNDANAATAFSGSAAPYLVTPTQVTNPQVFTMELWFATSSTTGGKLMGFGNSQSGISTSYDRHLYMLNTGQLVFGVSPGVVRIVQSPLTYNDGAWHHAVAVFTAGRMELYVDGVLVANRADVTGAQNYAGWWRIGADNLTSWTGASTGQGTPTDRGLTAAYDEPALYTTALTAEQVAEHYLSSRS